MYRNIVSYDVDTVCLYRAMVNVLQLTSSQYDVDTVCVFIEALTFTNCLHTHFQFLFTVVIGHEWFYKGKY